MCWVSNLKRYLCSLVLLAINVSSRHFASKPNRRCMPAFDIEWVKDLGTSPFAAVPLIADIDADGHLDVIAASFTGDIHVLSAVDGSPLPDTRWPFILPESTVHSSPLQFDFDKDGTLDIFLFTSQGEIYILSWDGTLLKKHSLNGLSVDRNWYQKILAAEEHMIHDYVLDTPTDDPNYVTVDPHVLATPALVDLNADGVTEELVVPVTYYYDLDYYSNPEALDQLKQGLSYNDLDNYLISSLLIFNATEMSLTRTIHMELTKVSAAYPGYLLFTPTLVALDGTGGPLDIVTGSSAGHLHVYSADGKDRPGFPVPTDTIHGQITVEDITQDGRLDLLMADVSGNVACYDLQGKVQWEGEISGTSPSGARVADLHGDGKLQVVMTADDGFVWVLDGKTGQVLEDWPFKIRGTLTAPPLLTRIETLTNPAVIVLDSQGYLQILGHESCRQAVNVRETSLVPILSHDLIPSNPGLEMLVATKDGALLCIGQSNKTGMIPQVMDNHLGIYTWPGETKSVNNFMYGKYGLDVDWTSIKEDQITSHTFSLSVTVLDHTDQRYTVHVSIGSVLLGSFDIEKAFIQHHLLIPSPNKPMKGHLVVKCVNNHGKVTESIHPISFHQTVVQDLQWLLVSPTLAMGLLLLFLYGFPPEDLLPSFYTAKSR